MKSESLLTVPMARVLKALMPNTNGKKPALTRVKLAVRAGFNPTSGTVNRALHGIPKKSASAEYSGSYKGLIDLGFVEKQTMELDEGSFEKNYTITAEGIKAFKAWTAEHGKLPSARDKKACVNARYAAKPTKVKAKSSKPRKAKAPKSTTKPSKTVKPSKTEAAPLPEATTAA